MEESTKKVRIELMVLRSALLALLTKLEEKGILTLDEELEILNITGVQLKRKE